MPDPGAIRSAEAVFAVLCLVLSITHTNHQNWGNLV
jgi:hypothetical protein